MGARLCSSAVSEEGAPQQDHPPVRHNLGEHNQRPRSRSGSGSGGTDKGAGSAPGLTGRIGGGSNGVTHSTPATAAGASGHSKKPLTGSLNGGGGGGGGPEDCHSQTRSKKSEHRALETVTEEEKESSPGGHTPPQSIRGGFTDRRTLKGKEHMH